jgi:hypothetical protein
MEVLIENSSNSSIFNLTNQTCLVSNVKESNDTLNTQESNNILGDNTVWFDKYLIPSKAIDSSPEMILANTSINKERNSLSNTNPTPCIKFGMQNRVKKLFKRNKMNIESKNGLKKLDGLLNFGFDIGNLDSDV